MRTFIKENTRSLIAVLIIAIALFAFSDVGVTSAARVANFFKKSGDNILFTNSSFELGSSGTPTTKGWFTGLDVAATTTRSSLGCNVFSGSFADATTTLFALSNPFEATSTVTYWTTENTGVSTSSANWQVGSSTSAFPNSDADVSSSLLNVEVATDTLAYFSSSVLAAGIPVGGTAVNVGAAERIQLDPDDFFVVYATSTDPDADNGGLIGGDNTFAGTYNVEICR